MEPRELRRQPNAALLAALLQEHGGGGPMVRMQIDGQRQAIPLALLAALMARAEADKSNPARSRDVAALPTRKLENLASEHLGEQTKRLGTASTQGSASRSLLRARFRAGRAAHGAKTRVLELRLCCRRVFFLWQQAGFIHFQLLDVHLRRARGSECHLRCLICLEEFADGDELKTCLGQEAGSAFNGFQ